MKQNGILSAARSDEDRVIATIVMAFSDDPAARWMYPDTQQYLNYFTDFVRVFGGKAFECGSAYHTDGFSGAALWYPPGAQPDEDGLTALLQRSVAEQHKDAVFSVFEQMEKFHPTEPHWYLPLIGVDPIRQGNGLGSQLLQHGLIPCDQETIPAYLESTSPRSIPLYEKHGFELVGKIQVGMSPPIFPMVRRPR